MWKLRRKPAEQKYNKIYEKCGRTERIPVSAVHDTIRLAGTGRGGNIGCFDMAAAMRNGIRLPGAGSHSSK